MINLLTNPVSALYYTAIKDRLYCDNVDSTTRRTAQYTLSHIFEIVTRSVAPIVPHLIEEMYLHLSQKEKTYFTSVHSEPPLEWEDEKVNGLMEVVLKIRRDVNKELGTSTAHMNVSLLLSKKIIDLMKVTNNTY